MPPQRVLLHWALPLLQALQQLQAQRAAQVLLVLPPPQGGAAPRPLPGLVVWRGERRVWGGERTWRAASHPGLG